MMETYVAQIANGLVTALFVVDPTDTLTINTLGVLAPQGSGVQVGWTYDGTSFIAPVVPTPAPSVPVYSLTPRQIRLVLNANNLLTTVQTAVAAADQVTQIEWNYAETFYSNDSTLQALATQLGITQAQLDAMFVQGSVM